MRHVLTLTCVVLCAAGRPAPAAEERPTRPNLVVIYADDLGYGDAHCYNRDRGRIPTPNIDRPDIVTQLDGLMKRLVHEGRSTPGPAQANDVPVRWKPVR